MCSELTQACRERTVGKTDRERWKLGDTNVHIIACNYPIFHIFLFLKTNSSILYISIWHNYPVVTYYNSNGKLIVRYLIGNLPHAWALKSNRFFPFKHTHTHTHKKDAFNCLQWEKWMKAGSMPNKRNTRSIGEWECKKLITSSTVLSK